MPLTYFLVFAAISMTMSLCAALLRSHVILVMASLNTAVSTSIMLLAVAASAFDKPDVFVQGAVVIALSSLINLIFCGAIILAFRSRGRLRMGDYRDLRG